MKVCYVNAFYDPGIRTGQEFIERIYTVREFAREQAKLGNLVRVLTLFHRNEEIERDGVSYRFLRPSLMLTGLARAASVLRPGSPAGHYQPGFPLIDELRAFQPDVIHFFGLTLDLNLRLVTREAERLNVPVVAQYNGGRVPPNRLRRAFQRGNLRRLNRALFTTRDHALPWIENRMLRDGSRIVPFMETSSTFRFLPRGEARSRTGMSGNPVFLWTGRLHPEKDPVTALRAFARICQRWPESQLYLYYLTDELLPELRILVRDSEPLTNRVYFRGRAPYEEMEAIYNSADFFLQASTREASGCAALEAMSCGVIPLLSDIPSFWAMTGDGTVGLLFPPGDDASLADGVLGICRRDIPELSERVRTRFFDHLSFPVLARQLDTLYRELQHEFIPSEERNENGPVCGSL